MRTQNGTIVNFLWIWIYLSIFSTGIQAQFQRQYGTELDESFSKVIQSGTSYYVLGQAELIDGQFPRASVTLIDAQGVMQWTLSLDIASVWNDAVLTPSGDLLVVGNTLPASSTSGSLMGLVASNGGFTWVRSYDLPQMDGFVRIVKNPVPQNPTFPYYVLGTQTDLMTFNTDMFLLNLNESGSINWKKLYNGPIFFTGSKTPHDMEAMPNGDLLMAVNFDTQGLIMRTDNGGLVFGGVTTGFPATFTDITRSSDGGVYAVAAGLQNGLHYMMKFDSDLIGVSDVNILGINEVHQIAEGNGDIYVCGSKGPRQTVLKFTENNNIPSLSWIKALDNGIVDQTPSTLTFLQNGQIAYADGRTVPQGGFGELCAILSISDAELTTCMTVEESGVELVPSGILYEGPLLPDVDFYDIPQETNIMESSSLDWQQADACGTPCVADFSFDFPDCNPTVFFTDLSTSNGPLSYFWHFGYSTGGIPHTSIAANPAITFPAQCSTYNVCLTITGAGCSDTICKPVTIKYPQTPVLTCPQNITLDCDADISPAVTGFAILTGACSGATASISFTDTVSGVMPCNGTIIRTWTALDECNVTRTCVQIITIQDITNPTALCQLPQGYDLDSNCELSVTPGMIDGGSFDNCQLDTMIINPTLIDSCGITQVTLTAIDICGNVNTCTTQIQTIESDPPVINNCPQNLTIAGAIDASGNCMGIISTSIPTVSDNCPGPYTLINDYTNTADASGNYPGGSTTVTWTATDACGNIATCDFVVTILCDSTICCPEFKLVQLENIRPCFSTECRDSSPNRTPMPGTTKKIACKNSIHTYYVLPNLPGFTYNWSITGGTLSSVQGNNPGIVTWGNGNQGYVEVIISDLFGNCRDTLALEVCLIDAPSAALSVAPNTTICENQAVTFTNTSTGANTYFWDFDDGTYSTLENPPPHVYSSSGIYNVILTVSNGAGNSEIPCGCRDTATVVITVTAGAGPVITSDCKKMLCPSDTSTYCVSPSCTSYTWSVNGGTILTMADSCITVVWNANPPATLPASVSVVTSCPSPCGNSATLEVPVLWNNIPISGPILVCVGDVGNYSLPVMPGTFYQWTVSGAGGTIIGPSQNTATFSVQWNGPLGIGTVICNYSNPFSGCSGSDTITVDVKSEFMITGSTLICEGDTIVYNTVPGSLVNWNIGGGTGYTIIGSTINVPSISVIWSSTGNYTVTATASPGNYCNLTSTINVEVNPAPVVNLSGPAVICPNQLYDYTASSSLSSGNFTWSFTGSGTATIAPYGPNNSSASVIFSGSGPWTLMATQTVDGCDGSGTLIIVKEKVPELLSSTITACIGIEITASVLATGGPGPYQWSSTPAVTLISGQGTSNAVYEVHSNGTITVSNCSGPSINSINVISTTPPPISITFTGSLCGGDLELSAPAGGVSYQWFGGGIPIPPNSLSVNTAGTYSVQVKDVNGCISTDTFAVFPVAIPTVTVSTGDPLGWCLPATPSVLLQAFTLGFNCTYQWYEITQGLLIGEVGSTYQATTAGTYYVEVTCGGCKDVSNNITVVLITCTGGGSGCAGIPNPLDSIIESGCATKTFSISGTACAGGTVNWNFGDGQTASGNAPVTHLYTSAGAYLVTASITCNNCTYTVHTNVNVPVVAEFDYIVQCGANGDKIITFINTSDVLGGWAVSGYNWMSDCGSPLVGNASGFILNTSPPCSPNIKMEITVSNSGIFCTDSAKVSLNLTNSLLFINGSTTVCEGATHEFTSSLIAGIIQYEWTVNGVAVSQNDTLSYVFDPTPANQMVGLTVTDDFGCTYTSLITVMVEMARPLTITPVNICPDCMPPDTLSASPGNGFSNYQWYQNGNLVASTPTYQLCNFNASGNYYVTANDTQNNNCPVISNTVQVLYLPKPNADIQGSSVICVPGTGPYTIALQNTGNPITNYLYNWTASGATFNPANNHSTTATVNQLGTYQFILTVTDAITGCMAMDTFCVYLYPNPIVTVAVPPGTLCSGTPHTFTASTVPTGNYTYLWSNGLTGPVMTTSVPGYYNVTATNLESGCSHTSNLIYIQYSPSLVLFPMGCDTICDSDSIPFPLALGGPFFSSGYNVQWFVGTNPTPIYTGTTLNLSGLVPSVLSYGNNDIYVIVTFQGCSDTSNVYDIFIDECCKCKSTISLFHGTEQYPVFCIPRTGFIPILPCPEQDVVISGFLGLVNPTSDEPCEETTVFWELLHPDGSTTPGSSTNFTNITFPKDSVSDPGAYTLILTTISGDGKDTCVCVVSWVRETCECCTTMENFSDKLDNHVILSVDETICKATLNIGSFNGCDAYIEWIDWDYPNNQQFGPFPSGSMPMHTYTASGTYIVCYLGIERDSTGLICFEKLVCDTLTLECPNCYCGAFSSMFIPLTRNVSGVEAFCDSTEIILGCPSSGNSIIYTGLFQCSGSNCPATAQVSWELFRLPNTSAPVASNTTTANPLFVINILPLWYAAPGSYELRLTGHCGLQECPCVFKFIIDCPDPCPCDVEDLHADVAQGFASSVPIFSCRGCFTPLHLNDCDSIAWYINSSSGTFLGNSSGNNTFCYQFAQSGSYTIFMEVTRRRSDGSICGIDTLSKTVNVSCVSIFDCVTSRIFNPNFSIGAVSGGLNSGGASEGWSAQNGDPVVVEGLPGTDDNWSIQLTGNLDVTDVLISSQLVCIPRQGGILKVKNKVEHRGDPHEILNGKHNKDWKGKYRLLLNGDADAIDCENSNCFELANIDLSPMDTGWYELEIPVDVSGWEAAMDCMGSESDEIEVTLAFLVSSPFNDQQGGMENSARLHIDQVCLEGTVSTEDLSENQKVRIYPNPVSQTIYIELVEAISGDLQIRLLSLTGQVLLAHQASSSTNTIDTSTIPSGLYFIEVIKNGTLIKVQKIVKH